MSMIAIWNQTSELVLVQIHCLDVSVIQILTVPDKTVCNLDAIWIVSLTYSNIKVVKKNFKIFQISGEVTAHDQTRSIYLGLHQESSLSALTFLQLRDKQDKINQQVHKGQFNGVYL